MIGKVIPNMRPNVFTSCNIFKKKAERLYPAIGVIAQASVASHALKVNKLSSILEARELYGEESAIACIISAVLQNIDTDVYAISVVDIADIPMAFDKLIVQEEIYCITVDTDSISTISSLKAKLADSGGSSGSKLCLCSMGAKTVTQATNSANSINSSRFIFCAPHIYLPFTSTDVSAGLVAAAISKAKYITSNLAGNVFVGKYHTASSLSEQDNNTLLYNGITVLEKSSDSFEIIRCVTTATRNPENLQEVDSTYRDISVIYALDKVSSRVSNVLKNQLSITTSSQSSLGALLTAVVAELESLKKARYLAEYRKPVIRLDSNDSSVCVVELEVTLSQGVNQIYVSLNITI